MVENYARKLLNLSVFTQRAFVRQVTIYMLKTDNNGGYVNVKKYFRRDSGNVKVSSY